MSDPTRQHAAAPPSTRPSVPEPSLAERARTLVHLGRLGSLGTLAQAHPGWPFCSLMPYAPDDLGRPLFLISSMAVHTHNLKADSRAALLVTQPGAGGDPLGTARITLMGAVTASLDDAREIYLHRHANARHWVDFGDFAFYRMEIEDVYFIGGFGVMGWVTADQYRAASPDPLADAAPSIIDHVNDHHARDLARITRVFAQVEVEEATMTSVDRLGFEARLKSGDRVHGTRIAFPRPAATVEECRAIFTEMARMAADTDRM